MELTITAAGALRHELMCYRLGNMSATVSHPHTANANIHSHVHMQLTRTTWNRKSHWSCWSHVVKKMCTHHMSHWMSQIAQEQIQKAGIPFPKALLLYVCSESTRTSRQHPSELFLSVTNIEHHIQKEYRLSYLFQEARTYDRWQKEFCPKLLSLEVKNNV